MYKVGSRGEVSALGWAHQLVERRLLSGVRESPGSGTLRAVGGEGGGYVRYGQNYYLVDESGRVTPVRTDARGNVLPDDRQDGKIRTRDPKDFQSGGKRSGQAPLNPVNSIYDQPGSQQGSGSVKYSQPGSLTGGGITSASGTAQSFVRGQVQMSVQSGGPSYVSESRQVSGIDLFSAQNRSAIQENVRLGVYGSAGDVFAGKTNPQFTPAYGYNTASGAVPIFYSVTPTSEKPLPTGFRKRIGDTDYAYRDSALAPYTRRTGLFLQEAGVQGQNFFNIVSTQAPDIRGFSMRQGVQYVGKGFGVLGGFGEQLRAKPDDTIAYGVAAEYGGARLGGLFGMGVNRLAKVQQVGFQTYTVSGVTTARYAERTLLAAGAGGVVLQEAGKTPREIGADLPEIVLGAAGFGRGYRQFATSNVQFGEIKDLRFSGNIEGPSLGVVSRGKIPTVVTEFGNPRTVDVPVTLVVRGSTEGSFTRSFGLRATATTDPFLFRGRSVTRSMEYLGVYNPGRRLQVLYDVDQTSATFTRAGRGRVLVEEGYVSRSIVPSRSVTVDLQPESFGGFQFSRSVTGGRAGAAYDLGYLQPQRSVNVPLESFRANYRRGDGFLVLNDQSSFSMIDQATFQRNPLARTPVLRSYLGDPRVPEILSRELVPTGLRPDPYRRFNIEGATVGRNFLPSEMRVTLTNDPTIRQGLRLLEREGLLRERTVRLARPGRAGSVGGRAYEILELPNRRVPELGRTIPRDPGFLNPEGLRFNARITAQGRFANPFSGQRQEQRTLQRNRFNFGNPAAVSFRNALLEDQQPRTGATTDLGQAQRYRINFDTVQLPRFDTGIPRTPLPTIPFSPIAPPSPPVFVPPNINIPLWAPPERRVGRNKRDRGSFKYVPSLTAGVFGITGPRPRSLLNPAEIRPLPLVRRRKR